MAFELSLRSSELGGYVEMGADAGQERQAREAILEEHKAQMPQQRNSRKLSLMDRRLDREERLESNHGRT